MSKKTIATILAAGAAVPGCTAPEIVDGRAVDPTLSTITVGGTETSRGIDQNLFEAAKASSAKGISRLIGQFEFLYFNGKSLGEWLHNAPMKPGAWDELDPLPALREALAAARRKDNLDALAALEVAKQKALKLAGELRSYPPEPRGPHYSEEANTVEALGNFVGAVQNGMVAQASVARS